jgi:TonB family protein
MKTELLAWLINATVATSLASLAVLMLRKLLLRWLGPEIAYRLWVVVPLAAIVAVFSPPQFAPAPTPVAAPGVALAPAIQVLPQHAWIASDADLWLLGGWGMGLLALIALLVWQQRRFVARMRLRPRADGSWRSGSVDAAPALLGLLRPRLVLPEAFEADYSDAEQRLVIAHERMHQQRRDPWALAICAALRVLFWFNPLLHVAAGRFRRDMEFACDAAVLRRYPDQRRLYAAALLKTQLAGSALPIGCLWHHVPPMKERIMLLKQALPARGTRLAGTMLVCIATLGAAGIALAGHASALRTASALAAPAPAAQEAPPYMVKLAMSVDGKRVANPAVIARPGEIAMVKVDENGVAWGLTFHVDRNPGSNGVTLAGEVFTGSEKHVIGHAQLAETAGTPLVIAMNDKAGGHSYRIEAQVAIAPPGSDRRMRAEAHASATAAPGEQREIEIVRNGTPAADDPSGSDQDEGMQGDTPAPGARREVRREITMRTPSGGSGNKRIEKTVIVETSGDGVVPMPPLPPLPPAPQAMPPSPPPMGMHAPPAPPAPPTPLAMRTPPPMPPLAPLPPAPEALPPPPSPPMPPPANDARETQGMVELRVLVGIDGHAKQVLVAKSDPPGQFDADAIKGAKQSRYTPQMKAGKPVEGWITLSMRFDTRREERTIAR